MKMIYVGSLTMTPDRDSGWIKGFEANGWNVIRLASDVAESGPALWRKIAQRLQVGSAHRNMRRQLVELCRAVRPAWVHFRLPLSFRRADITALQSMGILVTEYFNDDPFSPRRLPGLHRRFLTTLSAYDAHFVYRAHNVQTFYDAAAKHVEHCPPALDSGRFVGMKTANNGEFEFDAAFIGHFEEDGRLEYMKALHSAGFSLAIHGSGWGKAIKDGPLQHLYPAAPVFGARYGEIYARSRSGLCFFSTLNRDTWTERALEILAVGGVLVCQRTDEAMNHFRDGEEAFFFSSIDELIAICQLLKADPALRERVRKAGYARLLMGNHAIGDRATQVHEWVMARLASGTPATIRGDGPGSGMWN